MSITGSVCPRLSLVPLLGCAALPRHLALARPRRIRVSELDLPARHRVRCTFSRQRQAVLDYRAPSSSPLSEQRAVDQLRRTVNMKRSNEKKNACCCSKASNSASQAFASSAEKPMLLTTDPRVKFASP